MTSPVHDPLPTLPRHVRVLLRLLPAHVREEHGREIAQDLADAPSNMLHLTSDIVRAAPGAHWDVLRQDLTLAWRQMRRAPTFSFIAGLTLAIGIGGNVAFFTLMDGVLLQQLPLSGADRLVDITEENIGRNQRAFGISPANYRDYVADSTLFTAAAAYNTRSATLRIGDTRDRIMFAAVSGDFFRVLQDPPLLGRTLRAEDDYPGSTVVVLSEAFWRGTLGGDPDIIGRQIEVDSEVLQVVGVMPALFAFPGNDLALWRPLGFPESEWARRGARYIGAVARLRSGVTIAEAQRALALTAGSLETQFARTNEGWSVLVRGVRDARVGQVRAPLLLVWAAGGLVLLIAVANVASLFLTRAVGRAREVALRSALGARTGRVVKQLVTEAAVLSLVATAAGLLLAHGIIVQIRPLATDFVPRMSEVAVGGRALGYSVLLALVATTLLSLLAAASLRKGSLWTALGTGRASSSRERRRAQRGIVVAEVALAVLVLVGASLVGRTLYGLLTQRMGFDATGVLTFRVEPPWHVNMNVPEEQLIADLGRDRERAVLGYDRMLDALRQRPGVLQAGAINRLPLTGSYWSSGVRLADQPSADDATRFPIYVRPATAGYFEAMGTRVLRGRGIEPGDRDGTERSVVVDEEFARRAWGDANPLGRELLLDGPPNAPPPRARIVGVVESIHMDRLDAERRPTMYVPLPQSLEGFYLNWGMDVVVRGSTTLTAEQIRGIVRGAFADAVVFRIASMDEIVATSSADRRFQLVVLAFFAVLALVLATIGVAGTLLLAVRERCDELAVQMALGARAPRLWWQVQREGLLLAAVGTLLGLAAAVAAGRLFSSLVYGVPVRDAVSLVAAPALMLVACFLAAAIPAARALRIDPIRALRG